MKTNNMHPTKITKNPLYSLCMSLFLFLFLISCTNEEGDPISRQTVAGESEVLLSLRLPGASSPATRVTLSGDDENEVSTVDVLVFGSDGYRYTSTAYALENGTNTDPSYVAAVHDFTVRLQPTGQGETVDLWVVANARSWSENIAQGATKADVAASLEALESEGVTQLGATFTPIPMWGMLPGVTISKESGLGLNNKVNLTRMIAKIDVTVEGEAQSNFFLTHVYLYNRNTRGRIVPDEGNGHWTYNPSAGAYATAPSIPTTPTAIREKGPLSYTVASPYTEITNEIYTFEANAGTGYDANPSGYENEPCLVIVGKYGATSSPETFYRVDFVKTRDDDGQALTSPQYLDLLRNHCYAVTIEKVNGHGLSSAEEALKARPVNMEAGVIEWTESGMNHVVADDQYMLSVSRDSVTFYQAGGEQTINVYTDWENGWIIDPENPLPTWITAENATGGKKQTVTLALTAEALPQAVNRREGYFYITAGRLKKRIDVVQVDVKEVNLILEPDALVFKKTPGAAKTVKVTTVPANLPVTVTAGTPTGVAIGWKTDNSPLDYNQKRFPLNGTEMTLWPTAKTDPATESQTAFTFSVTYEGVVVTQTLNVTQLPTDYVFTLDPSLMPPYGPADYGTKTFNVLAETSWWLSVVTNPDNTPTSHYTGKMLTLTQEATTPHPSTGGVSLPFDLFTLAVNHDYVDRTATLRILSNDPNWAPYNIEVKQKGTPPFLTLNVPAEGSPTLDLDVVAQRQLTFTTNAGWTFTTGTGYTNVVSGQAYNSANISFPHYYTANTDALTPSQFVVALTPVNGSTADTEIAGTTISGQLTVKTANHGAANEVSKSVTVKRKAAARWDTPAFTPTGSTLPATVSTVRVTAHTNQAWFTGYKIGTATDVTNSAKSATAYNTATDYEDVAVPLNSVFATRSIQVWANKTGGDATTHRKTYTQDAATLVHSGSHNGNFVIPRGGGSPVSDLTLSFTGTYTGTFSVHAYAGSTLVGTNNSSTKEAHPVTVGANESWNDREITYRFSATGLAEQTIATSIKNTQSGYTISGTGASAIGMLSGNYTVTVSGDYPSGTQIIAVNAGNTTVATGSINSGVATLTIPSTSVERDLKICASNASIGAKELFTLHQYGLMTSFSHDGSTYILYALFNPANGTYPNHSANDPTNPPSGYNNQVVYSESLAEAAKQHIDNYGSAYNETDRYVLTHRAGLKSVLLSFTDHRWYIDSDNLWIMLNNNSRGLYVYNNETGETTWYTQANISPGNSVRISPLTGNSVKFYAVFKKNN
jgi:hypothetical protein